MPKTSAAKPKAVTVTQLAREAKVSVSLVSRYVNCHPSLQISDDTRRQIDQAAKRLGGMPRGRGGAAGSQVTITRHVVFPIVAASADLNEVARFTVAAQAYIHTRNALEEAGFRFSQSLYDADTLVSGVRNLITQAPRLADGLLLGTSFLDDDLTRLILQDGIPHVTIEPRAEAVGLNTVLVDEKRALVDAVDALRKHGHTRIGYFGPREYYRFAPIAGAIINAGLPFSDDQGCVFQRPVEVRPPLTTLSQVAADRFAAWLSRRDGVTALICSSDHLASIAVKTMADAGLTPGRDLSLIGYGNAAEHLPQAFAHASKLTTIDQRPDSVGRGCADVLIQQIRSPRPRTRRNPIHQTVPANLVLRDTVGPAPTRPSLLRRFLP